jgi:ParB-like chromosome segregation protein Spo0J
MAIDFKPEHKRGSEYLFAPEAIEIAPEMNGRHDLPDISGIVASIRKLGQLQAVGIRNDGGTPTLVYGFSRWRAICEINETRRPEERMRIRCIPVRCNEDEGLIANIHENRKRNPTTALDDAHNIRKLEQMGKTVAEIAEEYGEPVKWVNDRLSLLSLAPEAKERLASGQMKVTAALAISKLAAKEQKKAVKSGKTKTKDVKPPPERMNFGATKEAMQFIVREGKAPEWFECNRSELEVIDRFCQAMLLRITGRES